MTSRDEALRALEKKWRDDGRGCEESGVFGPPLVLYRCADELAAILSARQEVAPVADVEQVLLDYVADYEFYGEDEVGIEHCYTPTERDRILIEDAIRGWEALDFRTSPAQTSEARDLTDAQCDAVYSALDSWARDVDSYDFGLPMHAGGGNVTARDVIHAAMRQEAE